MRNVANLLNMIGKFCRRAKIFTWKLKGYMNQKSSDTFIIPGWMTNSSTWLKLSLSSWGCYTQVYTEWRGGNCLKIVEQIMKSAVGLGTYFICIGLIIPFQALISVHYRSNPCSLGLLFWFVVLSWLSVRKVKLIFFFIELFWQFSFCWRSLRWVAGRESCRVHLCSSSIFSLFFPFLSRLWMEDEKSSYYSCSFYHSSCRSSLNVIPPLLLAYKRYRITTIIALLTKSWYN